MILPDDDPIMDGTGNLRARAVVWDQQSRVEERGHCALRSRALCRCRARMLLDLTDVGNFFEDVHSFPTTYADVFLGRVYTLRYELAGVPVSDHLWDLLYTLRVSRDRDSVYFALAALMIADLDFPAIRTYRVEMMGFPALDRMCLSEGLRTNDDSLAYGIVIRSNGAALCRAVHGDGGGGRDCPV